MKLFNVTINPTSFKPDFHWCYWYYNEPFIVKWTVSTVNERKHLLVCAGNRNNQEFQQQQQQQQKMKPLKGYLFLVSVEILILKYGISHIGTRRYYQF